MKDREVLEDRMATLGLSLALLSSYVGISSSRLSPMFTGQKSFQSEVFQSVYKTLVDLERLQIAIGEDIPLDLRQIEKIKVLLERRRTGEVLVSSAF
jgi:hypothetical protein